MFCVEGCRAEHYVLSFADYEAMNLTVKNLMMLGYSVCDYFDDRQVVFGCHEAKMHVIWIRVQTAEMFTFDNY